MSQMQKPPEKATKRPVGRPRGSKNKPDAGTRGNPVGRPRKSQSAPTARARTAQGGLRTGTQGAQEPLTGAPPVEASPVNPVVIDVPVVASCCCRGSESAPPVSSANTQRDTNPRVELGSGKTQTRQTELTTSFKLILPKVQASGEKGSFSSTGDGAPTVVRPESGKSVLYYAYKLQSNQTTTTKFKYVDPSRLVSAAATNRSQSKAGSSRKRVRSETGDSNDQEGEPSAKRRRAPRTCLKCRRMDCPGRWKVDKCTVSSQSMTS